MPIYEYTCKGCGERFEQLVRTMSGSDDVKCPKCGSPKTARALSVFAVSSSGGGGTSKSGGGSNDVPTCGRCGGPPGSCSM